MKCHSVYAIHERLAAKQYPQVFRPCNTVLNLQTGASAVELSAIIDIVGPQKHIIGPSTIEIYMEYLEPYPLSTDAVWAIDFLNVSTTELGDASEASNGEVSKVVHSAFQSEGNSE